MGGLKRRRTQAIEINTSLQVVRYYLAFGRNMDDEVRVFINNGVIEKVTIGDRDSAIALADLLASASPQFNVSELWRWLKNEYKKRTE
jgi:hypothetical protein